MKRIKEPLLNEQPTEAHQLLWVARASDEALETAANQLEDALRLFMSENIPGAAAHVGLALQAVREGKARAGYLQSRIHETFGEEVEP